MSGNAESFFARRVREECGKSVYEVATDPDAMRQRICAAIISSGLAEITFGRRHDGSIETFRQAYERFYGLPLQPPPGDTNGTNRTG
jgi:hypothetical protein